MLVTTFFQAVARPVPSIVITVLRQVVFLIPLIYIFPIYFGVNGIFFAQPISDGLALALSLALVVQEHRRLLCTAGSNSVMVKAGCGTDGE